MRGKLFWQRIKKTLSIHKVLFAILILASFLRFWGLVPNMLHPDEGPLQVNSWKLIGNIVSRGDFNPHTYKYGTISFYLQAIVAAPVFLFFYIVEIFNFFITSSFNMKFQSFGLLYNSVVDKHWYFLTLVGRGLTAIFGVGCTYLVYKIGKKLFNIQIGIISALLISIAPLHVRDSHYITTDIPMLFFVLLSFYFLLNLFKNKSLKWYVASGITLGISSTIKFFPIALLAYPVAIIYAFEKNRKYLLKVFISLCCILIGIFIGLPFVFIEPNGPILFMEDLSRYALPWYGTSITSFIFSLVNFIMSSGKTTFPDITQIVNLTFRPFFTNFLIFNGFGILPSIFAISGFVLLMFKDFKKFVLLSIIPLTNFIYISAYLPVYYERLLLPTLGFLVIYSSYFIFFLFSYFGNKYPKKKALILVVLLFMVIFQPIYISTNLSLDCGKKTMEKESSEWIAANITEGSDVAYMPEVSFPAVEFNTILRLQPDGIFSSKEVLDEDIFYSFINAAKLEYYDYMYFVSDFPPNKKSLLNSHIFLVLAEYFSNAKLINIVQKSNMCDNNSRIYYYQLQKNPIRTKELVKLFDFNKHDDIDSWSIEDFYSSDKSELQYSIDGGIKNTGALTFFQKKAGFTPLRVYSEKISVESNKNYHYTVLVHMDNEMIYEENKIYSRIDFYNDGYENTSEKMRVGGAKLWSIFLNGLTPIYYEQLRLIEKDYSDINLPGEVVALSSRKILSSEWIQLDVEAKAPVDSKFAILSVSVFDNIPVKLIIDDVKLYKTN